jgi:hypothetical protein
VAAVLALLLTTGSVSSVVGPSGVSVPSGLLVSIDAVGQAVLSSPDATAAQSPGRDHDVSVVTADFKEAAAVTDVAAQVDRIGAQGSELAPANYAFTGGFVGWNITDFADHDQALVAVGGGGLLRQWGIISVAGSRGHQPSVVFLPMGAADTAVGDPEGPGVIAVSGIQPSGRDPVVDTDVEIRRAGSRPRVVATAAELVGDLGLSSSAPTTLEVAADARGDKLAVTVDHAGIVILDRKGRLLQRMVTSSAQIVSAPAWAPDGRSLVYGALGGGRSYTVRIWRPGRAPRTAYRTTIGSGVNGGVGGICLWAGNGSGVLCQTGVGASNRWVIVEPSGGAAQVVTSTLRPFAWLT